MYLAGAAGRLNAVTTTFDWNDRYNLWSGLIGGMFLSLSYFGCDQSQVQRYLTGKSIAQSRLSLLFTAMAKIPMQFFILFIGAMVFVFYIFDRRRCCSSAPNWRASSRLRARTSPSRHSYQEAFAAAQQAALALVEAHHQRRHARGGRAPDRAVPRARSRRWTRRAPQAASLVERTGGEKDFRDTNYIFLSFVTKYLPAGIVGLVIAVIFAATMSSSSGEINSLATVSVVDIYRRHFRPGASDHHYLMASRVATLFWGAYAVAFAGWGKQLGSLIEAVNIVGSLFYGSLLGCFVLAFFFRGWAAPAAFVGMLAGEAAIFAAFLFTGFRCFGTT